jgi:outer membrane cobalamin receptor
VLYLAAALVACGVLGVSPGVAERDLWDLSLEELANVEVTSVSKSEERRAGAAAAVAVISGEEIRRSGVTSVAEALRMAPGIDVGRVTSSTWAVSSRGFGSLNSPKLLVLTDTRSIYTPLFSGVFWDVQDLLLEDVARIEVIRGPGASLWGSNAVNGVINISTKSAKDTHGLYFEGGGGRRSAGLERYVTVVRSETGSTTGSSANTSTARAASIPQGRPTTIGGWDIGVFARTGRSARRIRSPFKGTATTAKPGR